ncbi:hypothetical protein MHYP_G00272670 [Metynnis hypsauchen]
MKCNTGFDKKANYTVHQSCILTMMEDGSSQPECEKITFKMWGNKNGGALVKVVLLGSALPSETLLIISDKTETLGRFSSETTTVTAHGARGLRDRNTMVHLTSLLLKKYHGGHVVIRLALGGATNRPFYRIVAAYNKRARDGKYLEQLGSYDPLPNIYNEKLVSFNYDRIKYWMGCGAHPTKPVAKLLGLAGFFPLHPMTITAAERRRKAALKDEVKAEDEDQEEKQAEQ